MSWFRKLFTSPEPQPRTLSDREKRDAEKSARWAEDHRAISECIPEIQAGIHRRIEQELALLAAVGLPLPTQLSPAPGQQLTWSTEYESYEYTCPLNAIKIENPQFSIPAFHYYVAWRKPNDSPLYYLIPNTEASQRDKLYNAYQNSSMAEFLSQFPGRWFNRDPYGYFYECSKGKSGGWDPAYILDRQRPEITAMPLQEVVGFSPDEVSRMERAPVCSRPVIEVFTRLPEVLQFVEQALRERLRRQLLALDILH